MRRLAWITAALAAFVVLTLVFAGLGVFYLAQRALPSYDGTVRVEGLRGPVEIHRDGAGNPHIYASNTDDLFFGQGYATAQDRLWQLEFNRRVAWGRLSELFGPLTLDADRLFRTMGLGRAAQEHEAWIDEESRRALQAYADGVNAYVASRGGVLPLEFSLLLTGFEPWRPVDSLAWSKMMAWQLSANSGSELLRAAIVGRLGAEDAAQLMPSLPAGVVPQTDPELDYATLGTSVRERVERVTGLVRPRSDELGSNNWVVSGERTASGKPLLANDTHLGLQVPPVWYAVHLSGGGLDVMGYSLPGTPGVVVGHNGHIAWGVTNSGVDVQDLYVERRNPENPNQFLFRGVWEEARLIHEEIGVRGWVQPLRLEIPVTRHGPVLNADVPEEEPIAMQWTALTSTLLPRSVLALARASNWEEFRAALRDFDAPSQNFVYADVEGNIGYQMSGLVPVRERGDGLLPVPGWTGEYEWAGWVPFGALPSALNPPEGFVATANDRVVGEGYPYLLTYEWAPPFRGERIRQMLSSDDLVGVETTTAMQLDVASRFAAELTLAMQAVGERGLAGEWGESYGPLADALALLNGWDHTVAGESPQAAFYNVFYNRLVHRLYADELGPDLFKSYLPASRSHTLASLTVLADEESPWFDDVGTPARERRGEIVWGAMKEAAEALARTFGNDPRRWRWGDFHTVTFVHPLGRVPLLDLLLNRGPFARGGDATTVDVSGYSFLAPYREAHSVAMRMLLDLGDWDQSLGIIPLGQSGQPLSVHYDDQLPSWLAGEYRQLPFARPAVDEATVSRLLLAPR